MTAEPRIVAEGMLQNGRRFAPRTFRDWAEATAWITASLALMPPVRVLTLRDLGEAPAAGTAQEPEAA